MIVIVGAKENKFLLSNSKKNCRKDLFKIKKNITA